MDNSTIKNHINRLSKGYKVWTVPLIMLMWDITFKTTGGNVLDVVKQLIAKPYFSLTTLWITALGLTLDYTGKTLVTDLQDTEDIYTIHSTMHRYNKLADLVLLSPAIYYITKFVCLYTTGGAISPLYFIADIHGAITLIALYDGIKAVKGNILIRNQLEF